MTMIPILTVKQMQCVDKQAIHGDLDLGYEYMKKAAQGLFEAIVKQIPNKNFGDVQISEAITLVCGKGNNGGDGYLLGKLLLDAGYRIKCFALCDASDIDGEAKRAYDDFVLAGGTAFAIKTKKDLKELSKYVDSSSLIVDAMLGTGASGEPRGIFSDVIKTINKSRAAILSVDTPSGLNNDDGTIAENCVRASMTIAMGYPKIGSFFYPARSNVGSLMIKDLSYPKDILEKNFSDIFFLTQEDLREMLPHRKPAGSKFDHGLTMMLCGSVGMTGSAVLSSMSSLRSGAGMVFLASPESAISSLSSHLIEVVLQGIKETENGRPALAAFKECEELADKVDAICIGPGISHEDETKALVQKLVTSFKKPIVLDADGLNAFKDSVQVLKQHKGELVITPHEGEFTRLFSPLPKCPDEKIMMLKEKAKEFNMTILLKGMPTIVVEPNQKAYILPYGNSGMATAGSGDVLSGIITSFIAQGAEPSEAALVSAYIHADAGNKASEKLGEYSMIARDILDNIPSAINSLSTIA